MLSIYAAMDSRDTKGVTLKTLLRIIRSPVGNVSLLKIEVDLRLDLGYPLREVPVPALKGNIQAHQSDWASPGRGDMFGKQGQQYGSHYEKNNERGCQTAGRQSPEFHISEERSLFEGYYTIQHMDKRRFHCRTDNI